MQNNYAVELFIILDYYSYSTSLLAWYVLLEFQNFNRKPRYDLIDAIWEFQIMNSTVKVTDGTIEINSDLLCIRNQPWNSKLPRTPGNNSS